MDSPILSTPALNKGQRKRRNKQARKASAADSEPPLRAHEMQSIVPAHPTVPTTHQRTGRQPNSSTRAPTRLVMTPQQAKAGPRSTSKTAQNKAKQSASQSAKASDGMLKQYEDDLIKAWNEGVDLRDAEELVESLAESLVEGQSDSDGSLAMHDYLNDPGIIIWGIAEEVKRRGMEASGIVKEGRRRQDQSRIGSRLPQAQDTAMSGLQSKPCGHQEQWQIHGLGKKGKAIAYAGDNPCFFTSAPHSCKVCGLSHPPCDQELVDLARTLNP